MRSACPSATIRAWARLPGACPDVGEPFLHDAVRRAAEPDRHVTEDVQVTVTLGRRVHVAADQRLEVELPLT